jgi:hypothetical protein
MGDNAILTAMRRMSIGKRRDARTRFPGGGADYPSGFRPNFIEHRLAHSVRDPNGRAYNRTAHLAERRKMTGFWADYLDKLMAGAGVIPICQGAVL